MTTIIPVRRRRSCAVKEEESTMATVLHSHVHSDVSCADLKESFSSGPLDGALRSALLAPTHSTSTSSAFLSLPPELILYILELLELPSLLEASRTCRSLHHLAYSLYLVRIGLGPQSGHLMLFNDESSRTLSALNAALFKPELGSITCVLQTNRDMVFRARREFDALRKVLGKLRSLEEFHLDFMDFKESVASTLEEEKEMGVTKRVKVAVVEEVSQILDAVVGLGCTKMTLCLIGTVRGDSVKLTSMYGGLYSTGREWGNRILRLLPAGLRSIMPPDIRQQEKPNKLKTFYLHSPILLERMFLNWTLDTLNHSQITTLSLNQMTGVPESLWGTVLPLLHLPQLTTLLVDVVIFKPRDAFEFLERHPRLEKLHIGSNIFCPQSIFYGYAEVPDGILPNLRHLAASPSLLVQFLASSSSLPKLSTVSILETIRPGCEVSLYWLRNTLFPITSRLFQIPKVQLTLSLRSQPSLFSMSYPPPSEAPDILSHITLLEVQIHVFCLSDEARRDFPAMLGALSGLKSLEFTTVAKAGPVEPSEWPRFGREILAKCLKLQTVSVNGEVKRIMRHI